MSDTRRLQTLLGEPAAALLEGAELRAWQPDPDHAPQAYYLLRRLDEAGFRALAQRLGLLVRVAPASPDAVWQLPAELAWPAWPAQAQPGALLAQGQVGALGLWLRWQQGQGQGQLQVVLLP